MSRAAIAEPQPSHKTDIWLIESTPTLPPSATPLPSQVVTFPLVKQDGYKTILLQNQQFSTSTPDFTDTPTPTLTPIFIPPQDVSTTMPIVFGAMVIVVVVIVAWFFVSSKEFKAHQDG